MGVWACNDGVLPHTPQATRAASASASAACALAQLLRRGPMPDIAIVYDVYPIHTYTLHSPRAATFHSYAYAVKQKKRITTNKHPAPTATNQKGNENRKKENPLSDAWRALWPSAARGFFFDLLLVARL
eukprot:scaffold23755_cov163-Isochrysis_galbana.AAC.5